MSSSWFVGYTPQMVTAVMYVRGDGNDALNGYMPSYFGADYPTRTWTATMQRILEGTDVEQFPPPAFVEATNADHSPTPSPSLRRPHRADPHSHPGRRPRPPTPRPTPSPTPSDVPSPTRTPSPTGHAEPHGQLHRAGA